MNLLEEAIQTCLPFFSNLQSILTYPSIKCPPRCTHEHKNHNNNNNIIIIIIIIIILLLLFSTDIIKNEIYLEVKFLKM